MREIGITLFNYLCCIYIHAELRQKYNVTQKYYIAAVVHLLHSTKVHLDLTDVSSHDDVVVSISRVFQAFLKTSANFFILSMSAERQSAICHGSRATPSWPGQRS